MPLSPKEVLESYLKHTQLVYVTRSDLYILLRVQIHTVTPSQGQSLSNCTQAHILALTHHEHTDAHTGRLSLRC